MSRCQTVARTILPTSSKPKEITEKIYAGSESTQEVRSDVVAEKLILAI